MEKSGARAMPPGAGPCCTPKAPLRANRNFLKTEIEPLTLLARFISKNFETQSLERICNQHMKIKNTNPTWIALTFGFGLLCGLGVPYVPPVEKDENHRYASQLPTRPERYAFIVPSRPPRWA